jgi:hypothetical protein
MTGPTTRETGARLRLTTPARAVKWRDATKQVRQNHAQSMHRRGREFRTWVT